MSSKMALSVVFNLSLIFFFNDTAATEIYTLSLHDALPIWPRLLPARRSGGRDRGPRLNERILRAKLRHLGERSEEHTSELQSRQYLVCRLLLVKKKVLTTLDIRLDIFTDTIRIAHV